MEVSWKGMFVHCGLFFDGAYHRLYMVSCRFYVYPLLGGPSYEPAELREFVYLEYNCKLHVAFERVGFMSSGCKINPYLGPELRNTLNCGLRVVFLHLNFRKRQIAITVVHMGYVSTQSDLRPTSWLLPVFEEPYLRLVF